MENIHLDDTSATVDNANIDNDTLLNFADDAHIHNTEPLIDLNFPDINQVENPTPHEIKGDAKIVQSSEWSIDYAFSPLKTNRKELQDSEINPMLSKLDISPMISSSRKLSQKSSTEPTISPGINFYSRIDNKLVGFRMDIEESLVMLESIRNRISELNLPRDYAIEVEQRLIQWINDASLNEMKLYKKHSDMVLIEELPYLFNAENFKASVAKQTNHFGENQSSNDRLFASAVLIILNDSDLLLRLCKYESMCNKELRDVVYEYDKTVSQLREVQLHEMEFLGQSMMDPSSGITSEDIALLSMKHVEATETVETEFQGTIDELQTKHHKRFRTLVLTLASANDVPESSRPCQKMDSEEEASTKDKRCSLIHDITQTSVARLQVKGLSCLLPSEEKQDVNNLQSVFSPMESVLLKNWKPTEDMTSNTMDVMDFNSKINQVTYPISAIATVVESFDIFLGAQFKKNFHMDIHVIIGGILQGVRDLRMTGVGHDDKILSQSLDTVQLWRKIALEHLYRPVEKGITAVAMPQPEHATHVLNERLMAASRYSSDPHFDKRDYSQHGNVHVTWHSNLGMQITCGIHGTNNSKDESIKDVILAAAQLGVSHLIIPLREWVLEPSKLKVESDAMKSGTFERSALNPKRVAALFKAVKSTLTTIAHRNSCGFLQHVTFVLKSTCPSLTLVDSVVEYRITKKHNPQVIAIIEKDKKTAAKAKGLLAKIFET